jgi:hypothetical protein
MYKVCNKREGVFVGDSPFIETAVVLDWVVFPILFVDKEESTGIW